MYKVSISPVNIKVFFHKNVCRAAVPQNVAQRPGGFAKLGIQPYTVWVVTGGFRTRRSLGCHFTPQFRKTACCVLASIFSNQQSFAVLSLIKAVHHFAQYRKFLQHQHGNTHGQ